MCDLKGWLEMLISKEVEVSWYYKTRKHYEGLGYEYTKQYDKFIVHIEHLHKGSIALVEVECDYCGKVFTRRYADHIYIINKEIINKDACKDCGDKKSKEGLITKYGVETPFALEEIREKTKQTFLNRYGVDNPFEIKEVKEKIKETNLEKYGAEFYTQTDEYKIKSKQTSLERYGVDNPSKNKDILNKIKNVHNEKFGMYYSQTSEFKERYKQTCIDKYGVENSFQANEVKEKIVQHNLKTYGVTHPMKIKQIAKSRFKKMVITKYKNGSGISSRQQDYIGELVDGDVNYPFEGLSLDIKLDDKKFIEYDGSGHDLSVKHGEISESGFIIKEKRRKYFLTSNGWKEIRIISKKDFLPNDDVIKRMVDEANIYLDSGHSWIKYDIDNDKVICSQYDRNYDFGELRKIKEEDLERIS